MVESRRCLRPWGGEWVTGPFSQYGKSGALTDGRVTGGVGSDWAVPLTAPTHRTPNGPKEPVAWTASGGGFSWLFEMPDYQKQAVNQYLDHAPPGLPARSSFNAQGMCENEVVWNP